MRELCLLLLLLLPLQAWAQSPLGSAISYQGELKDAGQPAMGLYDFQACLFDAPSSPAALLCAPDAADIPVEGGIFTMALDFGAAAFAGQARYLELRVRPGASTGAYTSLLPRQLVRPAPEALRAATSASAPWVGLSGVPAGFADGIDNVGSGTVSSIATGSGLTGGPISTSGTIAIATGGVSSNHIANGAVGSAQVNAAQVQLRISGSCAIGTYLRGINADGSLQCAELPGVTSIATLVSSPLREGEYSSIAIGLDGIPLVSYSAFNAGGFFHSLMLARCLNPSCSGPPSVRTIDTPSVGTFNSMKIGQDGAPVISYYDASARALKVAKCGNPECSTALTLSTVDDPANDVGSYSSLALGLDGNPVISYRDITSTRLKVAKCVNPACTGTATITPLDGQVNDVGEFSSIAVGPDGLPVISYYDRSSMRLKMAKCSNPACTTGTLATVASGTSNLGQHSAIAIDGANLPVISYQNSGAGILHVAKCLNTNCTMATLNTIDDPSNAVGAYTAIAIPEDGLPVISYYDISAQALKVAKCSAPDCSGAATITTLDDPGNDVGQSTAIAMAADGLPIISYRDVTAGSMKLAKCGSRSCR